MSNTLKSLAFALIILFALFAVFPLIMFLFELNLLNG